MRTIIVSAITALALFGCSKKEEKTEATPPPPSETTTGGEMGEGEQPQAAACPMEVQGTTVQAENVEGGAALIFMTTGDVDDLRERVRHFAAMEEAEGMRMSSTMHPGGSDSASAKSSDQPMNDEQRGAGVMGGVTTEDSTGKTEAMPQVNTRVEDIEGGARMVIIPMDSSHLDDVRMHVEDQAQIMTSGECAMSQKMNTGSTDMKMNQPYE